ncbi:MRE11B [Zea mays]|uniref:Double-strand break repair protein n=1 Tax=Zea mays TaxID=4577 RepID=A0A1D6PV53_MAIZE|nr:MRE11B [Zea mays]
MEQDQSADSGFDFATGIVTSGSAVAPHSGEQAEASAYQADDRMAFNETYWEEKGGNSLRVLVATDCHLGYLEKDEVRGFDSFDTFEEICSLAVKNKVDFLLLCGNLFHENKPSNSTLVKAIEILRRYCMNDCPVQFQVISDQAASLQNRFCQVNYEDPNYKIGLPVFTIHGDQDYPTGTDNLSVNDILTAGNFLNYFGKTDLGCTGVGKVTVYPVVIRKEPGAVNWMQPEFQDETPSSDWFNILVLHQKRTRGSPGDAISELLLPRFVDMVIWGHEHECLIDPQVKLIDPQEVPGMGFHITQPGSSIATSLINTEANPKHALFLEIKVVLEDQVDVDPGDEASIHEHLHKVVSNLIDKSREEASSSGSKPKLPLVRIKVHHTGLSTINSKQFGQHYVGKVVNPQDILLLTRSRQRHQTMQESCNISEDLCPNELNQQTVEALIADSNIVPNFLLILSFLKPQVLPIDDFNSALHEFVEGDDKRAFHACVQQNIEEAILQEKKSLTRERTSSENLQTDALGVFEKQKRSTTTEEQRALDSDDEPIESSDPEESGGSQQAGKKRRAAPGGGSAAAGARRKTDLAAFQRVPVKEDDAATARKRRPPVAAGRYGAVIRRRMPK